MSDKAIDVYHTWTDANSYAEIYEVWREMERKRNVGVNIQDFMVQKSVIIEIVVIIKRNIISGRVDRGLRAISGGI